jgi:hypothetical protein
LKNRQPGRWRDVQAREVEVRQGELTAAERSARALRHLSEIFNEAAEPLVVVGGSETNAHY